jgi:hypothetical protein
MLAWQRPVKFFTELARKETLHVETKTNKQMFTTQDTVKVTTKL